MQQLPQGTQAIRAVVADLNGQPRGKRLPVRQFSKVQAGALRMPLSALNLDIQGDDIENSPLVLASGDRDGVLRPTERGVLPVPWLDTPTAMVPVWMYTDADTEFEGDPRHALAQVLKRYAKHGWTPICATELEFYLLDGAEGPARPPVSPRSGLRRSGGEILGLRPLDAHDRFLTALYDGAAAMDIPADAATSESGQAQFEVNLEHGPAMKAADDAWLFKQLVKGVARQHDMAATFHPKPYEMDAGTGLHLHFSIQDANGVNVFDNGTEAGSAHLLAAVAGCLEAMPASMLVFAPHAPSYQRFVPGAHAPNSVGWAYENRTVALRIPSGPGAARRIEHRVAGGDTNPYLIFASILGAALDGIERQLVPPPPITGNAYEANLPILPQSWVKSVDLLHASDQMRRILPKKMIENLLMTKRQEQRLIATLSDEEQATLYLHSV